MSQGQSPAIDAAHITRRIDDFEQRINDLYGVVSGWLASGWSASTSNTYSLSEELMREFHIAPRNLPIMTIHNNGQQSATITPKGLYVFGGNGRLDLRSAKGDFFIIDQAAQFQPPNWAIAEASNRPALKQLTQQLFQSCL